jgi:hypothetical protein
MPVTGWVVVAGVLKFFCSGYLMAPRKITFGLPRLASEVSDSKGFHSGRRGGGEIFRGALKSKSCN